jgi:3-dehydroquinate dehydratase-2
MKILVINGPNLSRLDIRDSSIYGDLNYAELKSLIEIAATKHSFEADVRQSDDEATIIGWLHEAADSNTPVIINPAAFTHYSYAIRDAVELGHHCASKSRFKVTKHTHRAGILRSS